MAKPVVMPRLGWTMEEGSIVDWLKRDGDTVTAGEPLFTIESDKAVNECEALDSGVLVIPSDSPAPGVKVPIGAVLAYLVAPGESRASLASVATPMAGKATSELVTAAPLAVGAGAATAVTTPTISPRARRVAGELGVDWTGLRGSGRTGRIVERDVRAAAERIPIEAARPARLTPLARRAAVDAGLDAAALATSAVGSRVTRADVDQAARPTGATTPFAGVRRLTATHLTDSARTVAAVTLTTEADATRLVALQREAAEPAVAGPVPPTITALFARLTALALTAHPALNASLDGDAIVQHPAVHLGLAVDTERGLLVPVVRDADHKSAGQIAADAARLVTAARAGSIGPDDLTGGTFTITNLGMYDIDAFTPIINLPECAILGIGRILARPVVVDEASEAVAVRRMVALSLTFDHRLVDGAPAARFLQHLKRLIEQPLLWLLT